MKKFLVLLIACFFGLMASTAFAGTESLTFAWDKDVIETDLSRFVLQYTVDDPSGERVWEHLVDVPYVTGESGTFTETAVLTSPDDQEMWYWFRICAVDASENSSSWNYGKQDGTLCKAWIDFKAPGATIEFTVTVNVEPGP